MKELRKDIIGSVDAFAWESADGTEHRVPAGGMAAARSLVPGWVYGSVASAAWDRSIFRFPDGALVSHIRPGGAGAMCRKAACGGADMRACAGEALSVMDADGRRAEGLLGFVSTYVLGPYRGREVTDPCSCRFS